MSENKHTPEPWRWEINLQNKSVHIVGGRPMFDKIVMDFERWGMQSATPRFNEKIAGDEFNIMTKVSERPDWIEPFEGRKHHANWCANVTHPDARRIVACVNACAGVEDPSMYPMAKMLKLADEQRAACFAMEKQRDELLAALEKCRKELSAWMRDHGDDIATQEAVADARAAIASVKGEQP